MFTEERQLKIHALVRRHKKVAVDRLAKKFGVSTATIRTDLRDLERAGHILRTHGGALEKTKTGFELDSTQKQVRQLSEKQRIARAALTMIEDGDTILLDTGTTTLELAKLLRQRKNLTVVTNDLDVARLLEGCESAHVLLMGGIVRRGFHCTVGVQGRALIGGLTVDKAFMAANGFSVTGGATTPDLQHAETKKWMLSIANKVILLCDSSKLGRVAFARFATPDQIDILVTNAIGETERRKLGKFGVEVMSR